jgi:hypothetical protein
MSSRRSVKSTMDISATGGGRRAQPVAPSPFRRAAARFDAFATWLLLLVASAAWLAAPAHAQDTSLEEFDAVDPYTKGEAAAMERLGIVSFGPFAWAGNHRSPEVQEALGGVPVIFIETAHFRFASTLESYKLGEDREDKAFLASEMAEFKKLVPKFKPPTKIDPWLRAHLWARRFEALYEEFTTRFAITPDDFTQLEKRAQAGSPMGVGPYLGQKNKFTVLLTEQRSALGRYLKKFTGLEAEYSYRYRFDDSYFFGATFEALKDHERGFESAFAAGAAAALTANFVDAFRDSNMVAPEWFRYGLAQSAARKVDARWNQWGAGGDPVSTEDTSWEWEPRVFGLVKNNVVPTWAEMMTWKKLEDIKPRDHMIAWSRVEWLMDKRKDKLRDLLLTLTRPIDDFGPKREELRLAQQTKAFADVLGQDPAALDEEWRAWVLKTYAKKR